MAAIDMTGHNRGGAGHHKRKLAELQRLMAGKRSTPEYFEFSIDDRHYRVRNPYAPAKRKGVRTTKLESFA